jgi:hypothetical protein
MILYSEQESLLFNVKFGRYEGSLSKPEALKEEIVAQGYDFVRIKIHNAGDDLFMRLNSLSVPYHLLDIHRYYSLDYTQTPVTAPVASGMELFRNEGQLNSEIRHMVLQSFDEHPMGFFRNEVLENYFPVELQRQNIANYISSQYTQTTNPGRQAWLIKINGVNAGCGSTEFKGEEAYTTYIGLLPPYRKQSHYREVIHRMQYEIQQSGARYCTGSARLHNLSSQSVFEKQGEKYIRHDYVVMLMPKIANKD